MDPSTTLPTLLALAWLLPLVSFTLIVFFGPRMGHHGEKASWVATGAIGSSCVLSLFALFFVWLPHSSHYPREEHAAVESEHVIVRGQDPHAQHGHGENAEHDTHAHAHDQPPVPAISGDWYSLAEFGSLKITIGYYIDALTVAMFCMVTFIATCIHFYATGYMHDELHEITDHEVTLSDGHHLHRPGRFHRFFQYLSLFCFSMLGIVIAGNIAMVFVFWELVGICSYFLIGFYIERKSASNAANKAFIVNRVGDFGMIIGLMALFGALGTFSFGDRIDADGTVHPGLFSQVRTPANDYQIAVPDGMVLACASNLVADVVSDHRDNPDPTAYNAEIAARLPEWRSIKSDVWFFGWRPATVGYGLLIIAGLGIFCGCVGKSAQFPLHVWLPDAMEGPTPVSALVHSATMVAAGVYLVGRFYPVFVPEVLLVIALIGAITLFLAATIAITATDIKRVLAYSTVSQLGFMMLSLGVGGWVAGMFHLITHAFFKSLLFMCSGSVIHAVHTNEMPKMGGLRHKMPWTAYTMLVGCIAIAGGGIPFVIGTSGYYSKDAILAQLLNFKASTPGYGFLFYVAAGGAALTTFYMFRLWYMTFAGEPRDHHLYDHAHESPKIMYYPLVVLAVMAIGVGWQIPGPSVRNLLDQAKPAGTDLTMTGEVLASVVLPSEHLSHGNEFHVPATLWAFGVALSGFLISTMFYGWKVLSAEEARQQFWPIYRVLKNKWYFDELYNCLFIQPVMFVSRRIAEFDRGIIDWFIDSLARWVRVVALIDDLIDRYIVDGIINALAARTYNMGLALHSMQTGKLRQYVMFIVVGTVGLFVLASFYVKYAMAG